MKWQQVRAGRLKSASHALLGILVHHENHATPSAGAADFCGTATVALGDLHQAIDQRRRYPPIVCAT